MALAGLRSFRGLQLKRLLASPQRCPRIPCTWPAQRRWNTTAAAGQTSTETEQKEKPYYITTPIFYVNAAPHIGHLYSMVLGDVLKRWQQLEGKEAYLSTGTDEHGMKIQRAAQDDGVEPKDMCDENSAQFRDLADKGNISYDTFIRTTEPRHKEAVGHFYTILKQTGLGDKLGLYKGGHEGWYSVSDECFYPEDTVEPSVVPQTGKKVIVSKETGSAVEWVKEETWFFPLTKYKERLLKFYDENPEWIKPDAKMNEVRSWVENNLEDLSVTRPVARLSWGIQDPEDNKQTIYVWVDALINYLTTTGYAKDWHYEPPQGTLWPADLHIVGKDIVRFHAVYWPAMLMALDLPLPKGIVCHNHWTMSNRKMSKSVGNVVNPILAMDRWGVDPLRYFLMRNGSLTRDMDYSNRIIEAVYTKELQASLGNLYYRIFRPKSDELWSTRHILQTYGGFQDYEYVMEKVEPENNLSPLDVQTDKTRKRVARYMRAKNVSKALDYIYTLLQEANRFLTEMEPWKVEEPVARAWYIYSCMEALRVAAILLQPTMPTKATWLLDEMGVRADRRTFDWAERGADLDYGLTGEEVTAKGTTTRWNAVFPQLPTIDQWHERQFQKERAAAVKEAAWREQSTRTESSVVDEKTGGA